MHRLRCVLAFLVAPLAPAVVSPAGAAALDEGGLTVVYTYFGNHYPPTHDNPLNPTPDYHNEYVIIAKPGSAELKMGSYGVISGEEEPEVDITRPLSGAGWSALLATAQQLPEPMTSHPYYTVGDYPVEAELYRGETSVRRGFYDAAAAVKIHDIFVKLFNNHPGLDSRR